MGGTHIHSHRQVVHTLAQTGDTYWHRQGGTHIHRHRQGGTHNNKAQTGGIHTLAQTGRYTHTQTDNGVHTYTATDRGHKHTLALTGGTNTHWHRWGSHTGYL